MFVSLHECVVLYKGHLQRNIFTNIYTCTCRFVEKIRFYKIALLFDIKKISPFRLTLAMRHPNSRKKTADASS